MVFLAVLSVLIMAILITFVQYEQFYREMRSAVKNSAVSLSDLVNNQGAGLLNLIQKVRKPTESPWLTSMGLSCLTIKVILQKWKIIWIVPKFRQR